MLLLCLQYTDTATNGFLSQNLCSVFLFQNCSMLGRF